MTAHERLFSFSHALDHPATQLYLMIIGGLLLAVPPLVFVLRRFGVIGAALSKELYVRTLSWSALVVLVIGPILLGACWAILLIFLISLIAYIEYARITGLFREALLSWAVLAGITVIYFAVLDHWYGLFMAMIPIGVVCLTGVALIGDRPKGYVQRVALAVLGFLLFGVCLGHLAYFSNSTLFRPLLIVVFLATAMNDVFAFCVGKAMGRRKLCPNTSPNKTIAGALGALVLSSVFVLLITRPLLPNAPGLTVWHLLLGGAILSICGQLGDLMLSAIKRDIGLKDTGNLIPGHGGILDRVDSLVLVAPASFHFVGYLMGVGLDQQTRIISG
jgi:phosphatidate cytidylyltransferase